MNILNYLAWRNDVPFTLSYFNEVDGLILSELAYIDYEGMASHSLIPIKEVNKNFFLHHDYEDIKKEATFTKRAPLLFKDMCDGERFSIMQLANYVNEVDEETSKQFSAITFLWDQFIFIAFRGTDQSVVGWKEDFLLSSSSDTESEKAAVRYINQVGTLYPHKMILVGGHSKGGHLAVYGATYCDQEIKKRIKRVYSYDGPGFREDVLHSLAYCDIKSRIIHVIPDMSAIGLMLSYEVEPVVIKSDTLGLYQHDAFSWQVQKDQFVYTSLSKLSTLFGIGLGNWLEELDDESRKEMITTIFSIIEATGKKHFKDMNLINFYEMIKESKKIPPTKRKELLSIMYVLIRNEGQAMKDVLLMR